MGADPQALEGVVEDLKKTVRIVPQCGYAAFSLATVYHRLAGMGQSMQMLSQATRGFEEAYSKFPTFTDGMILYAMVRTRSLSIVVSSPKKNCLKETYTVVKRNLFRPQKKR